MTDRDLLEQAIKRSGLSARAFAVQILWRDERTVRRWLSGESPVPAVVADRLREELGKDT
jgi:plasmid maintenance system antidote protein VapI